MYHSYYVPIRTNRFATPDVHKYVQSIAQMDRDLLDESTSYLSYAEYNSIELPSITVKLTSDHPKQRFSGFSRFGLFVDVPVPRDRFIVEYVGLVMSPTQYKSFPINQYRHFGCPKPGVLFHPTLPIVIDARKVGSEARFLRRSCQPNCKVSTVIVDRMNKKDGDNNDENDESDKEHVVFAVFPLEPLKAGTELTIPWEWDPRHPIRKLIESSSSSKSPTNLEQLSKEERNFLVHSADMIQQRGSECACNLPQSECAISKMKKALGNPLRLTRTGAKTRASRNGLLDNNSSSSALSGLASGGLTSGGIGSKSMLAAQNLLEEHDRSLQHLHPEHSDDAPPISFYSKREARKLQNAMALIEKLYNKENNKDNNKDSNNNSKDQNKDDHKDEKSKKRKQGEEGSDNSYVSSETRKSKHKSTNNDNGNDDNKVKHKRQKTDTNVGDDDIDIDNDSEQRAFPFDKSIQTNSHLSRRNNKSSLDSREVFNPHASLQNNNNTVVQPEVLYPHKRILNKALLFKNMKSGYNVSSSLSSPLSLSLPSSSSLSSPLPSPSLSTSSFNNSFYLPISNLKQKQASSTATVSSSSNVSGTAESEKTSMSQIASKILGRPIPATISCTTISEPKRRSTTYWQSSNNNSNNSIGNNGSNSNNGSGSSLSRTSSLAHVALFNGNSSTSNGTSSTASNSNINSLNTNIVMSNNNSTTNLRHTPFKSLSKSVSPASPILPHSNSNSQSNPSSNSQSRSASQSQSQSQSNSNMNTNASGLPKTISYTSLSDKLHAIASAKKGMKKEKKEQELKKEVTKDNDLKKEQEPKKEELSEKSLDSKKEPELKKGLKKEKEKANGVKSGISSESEGGESEISKSSKTSAASNSFKAPTGQKPESTSGGRSESGSESHEVVESLGNKNQQTKANKPANTTIEKSSVTGGKSSSSNGDTAISSVNSKIGAVNSKDNNELPSRPLSRPSPQSVPPINGGLDRDTKPVDNHDSNLSANALPIKSNDTVNGISVSTNSSKPSNAHNTDTLPTSTNHSTTTATNTSSALPSSTNTPSAPPSATSTPPLLAPSQSATNTSTTQSGSTSTTTIPITTLPNPGPSLPPKPFKKKLSFADYQKKKNAK